jgi:hypothetical protein
MFGDPHRGWQAFRPRGRDEKSVRFRPPNDDRPTRHRFREAASAEASLCAAIHVRVFVVHDHSFAAAVDHDGGNRRLLTGTPSNQIAVNPLHFQFIDNSRAEEIIADARSQSHFQPEPLGGYRGGCRRSASVKAKAFRPVFLCPDRKLIHGVNAVQDCRADHEESWHTEARMFLLMRSLSRRSGAGSA